MQHEPSSEAEIEEQGPVEDSVETEVAGQDGEGEEPHAEESSAGEEEEQAEPTAEEQIAEWRERAMRSAADLENFRKRMEREKREARCYANQLLLEELLPVFDNFQMGLQAAAADSESMIYRGMEMVKKQLDEFLSSQGVEEIRAEGEIFDPSIHEAVSQEECSDSEEGKVLRVIRRGYRMSDRLLRPANVVVARAPEPDEVPAPAEREENK
jgi:molecular chaperone GrpE